MDNDDDTNPFAEPAMRQPPAQSLLVIDTFALERSDLYRMHLLVPTLKQRMSTIRSLIRLQWHKYACRFLSSLDRCLVMFHIWKPAPPPSYADTAAYLSPSPAPPPPPAPVYQSPTYPAYPPPPAAAIVSSTPTYGSDPKQASTRIDIPSLDKQQAQVEQRDKHLAEREKALQTAAPIGSEFTDLQARSSRNELIIILSLAYDE